jgi:ASC-1-like (ASCH) protein
MLKASFFNEYGNKIKADIRPHRNKTLLTLRLIGPDSMTENIITYREAKVLKNILNSFLSNYNESMTTLKLKEPFYTQVKNGTKTLEGRVNDNKRKKLKQFECITITDTENNNPFEVVLNKLTYYDSFEEMVQKNNTSKLIPSAKTKEEALAVYINIPGYVEEAKVYGVVCLHISIL